MENIAVDNKAYHADKLAQGSKVQRLVRGLYRYDPNIIRDSIRADIHTPDVWKHVKPFWEIYNAQSQLGVLPERS